MEKIVMRFFKNYSNQPPFIRLLENGLYSLVGNSDKATGKEYTYKGIGSYKLTAMNHSNTLLAVMKFIIVVDAMEENEILNYEDEEIKNFLRNELLYILQCFFWDKEDVNYSDELMNEFIENNKQIINEALYNITADKEAVSKPDYQSIVDGLEGEQFSDFYVDIAYTIAKEMNIRPYDVIMEWSSSELIVFFAKLKNENSLEAFLNYKYSQPKAPKRKAPKKQLFFFEQLENEETKKGEEENGR